MTKKYINLCILLLITTIGSCKNDGKQVESTNTETTSSVKTTTNIITYNKVKKGSYLAWRASHFGGVNPRNGKIYYKETIILVESEKITSASIIIDMNKLIVDNLPTDEAKELAEHLKSDDFFSIKTYPTSKFELTKLEIIQGNYNSKITGNLTILGKSKSITFKANIIISDKEISIKSEDFVIDRSDWGMTYNAKGTLGVPLDYLISDEIGFTIDVIVSKQEV
jgi:polyisoprenoid-binding protein YceI